MSSIDLIGVPFDGFGRRGHQARAPTALRQAGLMTAFGDRDVVSGPDLDLPEPDPRRASGSGFTNEGALLAMTDAVHQRVSAALAERRFPLLYGADCCVLLGAVTALRDATGKAGLVFVDGHEDTTPLDVSTDGEVANMEAGLLLGITGRLAPSALKRRLPALSTEALAMLGPRDHQLRRELNVGTLHDLGIHLRRHDEVAAAPAQQAREAVAHVAATSPDWWLHLDLDVLAQDEFIAQRVPGGGDEAGGLRWSQLTELVSSALEAGGCRGWSLVIYDPEQDPDGREARRIVEFVAEAAGCLR
jgi:arginase